MVQGGSVTVWEIFSCHTLSPLAPIDHHLNLTAYLSIVAHHVHSFITTVYTDSMMLTKLTSFQTVFYIHNKEYTVHCLNAQQISIQ